MHAFALLHSHINPCFICIGFLTLHPPLHNAILFAGGMSWPPATHEFTYKSPNNL